MIPELQAHSPVYLWGCDIYIIGPDLNWYTNKELPELGANQKQTKCCKLWGNELKKKIEKENEKCTNEQSATSIVTGWIMSHKKICGSQIPRACE